MTFVNEEDYKIVIKQDVLGKVIQAEPIILYDAERAAQSEIESYLRSRFDVATIFGQVGSARNALLVLYFVDVVLYHVHSRINPNQIPELRVIRYQRVIDWLRDVMKGNITPDLPTLPPEEGSTANNTAILYGSKPKRNNDF
jgi:phage gp36-like protein